MICQVVLSPRSSINSNVGSWNESKMSLKLSWRTYFLKEVSRGEHWGIKRSQFAVYECSRVLKWVNFWWYITRVLKGVNWMFSVVSDMCKGLERSQFDDKSQGSWKESNSDDLPYSLLWWSWKESLALISDLVKCSPLWRVLKWVNVHQFPEFLWIVSCCRVWRV